MGTWLETDKKDLIDLLGLPPQEIQSTSLLSERMDYVQQNFSTHPGDFLSDIQTTMALLQFKLENEETELELYGITSGDLDRNVRVTFSDGQSAIAPYQARVAKYRAKIFRLLGYPPNNQSVVVRG
jgi:hypothetical protein